MVTDDLELHRSKHKNLLSNLTHLTKDSTDPTEAADFRKAFRKDLNDSKAIQNELQIKCDAISKSIEALDKHSFCWSTIAMQANAVLSIMKEHDPVALKRAYYELFEKIIVSAENQDGKRTLTFIIRDGGGAFEDELQDTVKMVEVGGIEPPSASVP